MFYFPFNHCLAWKILITILKSSISSSYMRRSLSNTAITARNTQTQLRFLLLTYNSNLFFDFVSVHYEESVQPDSQTTQGARWLSFGLWSVGQVNVCYECVKFFFYYIPPLMQFHLKIDSSQAIFISCFRFFGTR